MFDGGGETSSLEFCLSSIAQHFDDSSPDLEHVEDLLESAAEQAIQQLHQLQCVQTARTHPEVLNDLLELCNECTANRAAANRAVSIHSPTPTPTPSMASVSPGASPARSPSLPRCSRARLISWEHLIAANAVKPDALLAYLTCLVQLAALRPSDAIDRRLGLMAARAYVLLLTVPDAQVYGMFHAPLLLRALDLLDLLARMLKADRAAGPNGGGDELLRKEHEKIELLINCGTLWRECDQMLMWVSLAEHPELRRAMVKTATRVMLNYLEHNHRSKYSLQLYEQCFGVFEHLCQSRHGDITDTMFAILRGTGSLNRFDERAHTNNGCAGTRPKYETMSSWFTEKLTMLPSHAAPVLTHFVRAILCNAALSAGPDELAANLDICVKYETALWRRGQSELFNHLLDELSVAADNGQRVHAVEFAQRLLSVEVRPNEELEAEASREVRVLHMLLKKMMDVSNTVKIRAMGAFLRVTQNGNPMAKEIIRLVFFWRTKARTSPSESIPDCAHDLSIALSTPSASVATSPATSPLASPAASPVTSPTSPTRGPRGVETLHKYRTELLRIARHNLANHSALVRKPALHLLEFLAQTNCDLDAFLRSRELRTLHADTSTLVRRQLILTLDCVLQARMHSSAAIEAYVRLVLDLAVDDDGRVADTVAESFRVNLFDSIAHNNGTATERTMLPWRLLRAMLAGRDLPDVRACIGGWVNKKLVTRKTLANIETHIHSGNANEAWILLSMVASHIRSPHPEFVVAELLKNIQANSPEANDTVYSQLEVLANWLSALEPSTQSEILRILDDLLGCGSVAPRHVSRTFEICSLITRNRSSGGDDDHESWAQSLRSRCLQLVLANMRTLLIGHLFDVQLVSCIFTYSEAVTVLPSEKPDPEVVQFLHEFMQLVAQKRITLTRDSTLPKKMNSVQIVLTKLSLFDYEVCLETVPLLGAVLNAIEQPSITITAIACLGDLYKKHTSLAETVLPLVLGKTRHPHHSVRSAALQSIACLILDEFIKFRGSLLIYMFAAMRDESRECSELATEMLLKYRAEKNPILMRSSLLECPFVLNGYVHLNNMDLFGGAESTLRSPIQGDAHLEDRRYIYRFLVHNVEAIHCYMYFGNVRMVADKFKQQRQLMVKASGLAAVHDFLYVLTHICESKEKSKRKIGDGATVGDGDDQQLEDDALGLEMPPQKEAADAAAAAETAAAAGGTKKKGAGRKVIGPTMEKALLVVEKVLPQIADFAQLLGAIDDSFAEDIDRLGRAMCAHFEALTHFAQPQHFWGKYKEAENGKRSSAADTGRGQRRISTSGSGLAKSPQPSTSKRSGSRGRRSERSRSPSTSKRSESKGRRSGRSRSPSTSKRSGSKGRRSGRSRSPSTSKRSESKGRRSGRSRSPSTSKRSGSRGRRSGRSRSHSRSHGSGSKGNRSARSRSPSRSRGSGGKQPPETPRSSTTKTSRRSEGEFVRPESRASGSRRSGNSNRPPDSPSQSESESDIERRAVRLARKRP